MWGLLECDPLNLMNRYHCFIYIPCTSIFRRSYRLCSVTTIDCNLESQTFCKCNVAIAVLQQLENFASSSISHYHWHTTFTLEQTFIPNFGKEDGTLHTVNRKKKHYCWVRMMGGLPHVSNCNSFTHTDSKMSGLFREHETKLCQK